MPPSCALLGGFAIGARAVLLWQHNANPSYKCEREMLASVLFSLYAYCFIRMMDSVIKNVYISLSLQSTPCFSPTTSYRFIYLWFTFSCTRPFFLCLFTTLLNLHPYSPHSFTPGLNLPVSQNLPIYRPTIDSFPQDWIHGLLIGPFLLSIFFRF